MRGEKDRPERETTRNVPPQLLAYPGDRAVLIALFLAVTLVFAYLVGTVLYDRYERHKYEAVCKMVESHPDLSVPCECALGTKKEFGQLLVEQGIYDKVENYFCVCRCIVDVENNITQVFAVPIAK